MKYHHRTGLKKRWSFGRLFTLLAIIGWSMLLLVLADTILFNGQGLMKVLMR